jgi:hypothetical protein
MTLTTHVGHCSAASSSGILPPFTANDEFSQSPIFGRLAGTPRCALSLLTPFGKSKGDSYVLMRFYWASAQPALLLLFFHPLSMNDSPPVSLF